MYRIALIIEKHLSSDRGFKIFESSGELLDQNKRETIERVLRCRVIDRYGLAEFGIVAYQNNFGDPRLRILDDIVWPESLDGEIVLTGLKNRCMPLIRYTTGDMGTLEKTSDALYFSNMYGRIHDMIQIGEKSYPTHYIQDVLDRIGGIEEFQIKKSGTGKYILNIVKKPETDGSLIENEIRRYWNDSMDISFISYDDLQFVGDRSKFRYLV